MPDITPPAPSYPPQSGPPQYGPPPGYTPPPGYGPYPPQPYPGYYGAPAVTTNGLAIASLVLGLLWIYWIGSILALVFGYTAKRQIAASHGTQGGGGLATAGIVLGWIGVTTLLFTIGFIAVATLSTAGSTY